MFDEVKDLINTQVSNKRVCNVGVPFSKYQKVYISTNENIKHYLNLFDFSNKKRALSVLASGDHIFNLINKDIIDIDSFDTNLLSLYYVLGLRRAMIVKYNYKEYLNIYSKILNSSTSLDEITAIITDLLPLMDKRYRDYWKEVNTYNYKLQKNNKNHINLFYMLFINFNKIDDVIRNNNYLENEEEYNKLRNNILRANITFKNINALYLGKEYSKNYDFILLSNILDYFNRYYDYNFTYKDLLEYESTLLNILGENGIIFLNYIMKYKTLYFTRSNVTNSSNIKVNELEKEKLYTVCSFKDKNVDDAILVLKKY